MSQFLTINPSVNHYQSTFYGFVSLDNPNTATKYLPYTGTILSDLHVLGQLHLTKPPEVDTIISIIDEDKNKKSRGDMPRAHLACQL